MIAYMTSEHVSCLFKGIQPTQIILYKGFHISRLTDAHLIIRLCISDTLEFKLVERVSKLPLGRWKTWKSGEKRKKKKIVSFPKWPFRDRILLQQMPQSILSVLYSVRVHNDSTSSSLYATANMQQEWKEAKCRQADIVSGSPVVFLMKADSSHIRTRPFQCVCAHASLRGKVQKVPLTLSHISPVRQWKPSEMNAFHIIHEVLRAPWRHTHSEFGFPSI